MLKIRSKKPLISQLQDPIRDGVKTFNLLEIGRSKSSFFSPLHAHIITDKTKTPAPPNIREAEKF